MVVGSGPNGLAAAVTMARAGLEVTVLEAQPTVGGGARTAELGLASGLVHDVCSAVHPMAWASPFFAAFDLAARGVELRTPEVSYAQPLPGGRAGIAYRDLERTVAGLGADGAAWRSLVGRLAQDPRVTAAVGLGDKRSIPTPVRAGLPGLTGVWSGSAAGDDGSGPNIGRSTRRAAGLVTLGRFGLGVLEQGTRLWGRRFTDDVAPALLTGVAAHAIAPLPSFAAAGTALLLAALAHAGAGWPLPRGGSGAIVAALVADLEAHGGRIEIGRPVRGLADLPPARCVLFDTTPRTVLEVLGDRVAPSVARGLRGFRYGNAAAKVDLVLSGPVPWTVPEVGRAGTVHVGGTRAEMARAEAAVHGGRHAELPMVLLSDPTVTDPDREVGGLRPVWAYAHVPAGSDVDVTEAVLRHVERYAPGVRDVVVAARCVPAARMSDHNANYVGGDIAAGAVTLAQVFARPVWRADPYRVPTVAPSSAGPVADALATGGVYLCSASTPPGPGVHGLGGWYAASRALRDVFARPTPSLSP